MLKLWNKHGRIVRETYEGQADKESVKTDWKAVTEKHDMYKPQAAYAFLADPEAAASLGLGSAHKMALEIADRDMVYSSTKGNKTMNFSIINDDTKARKLLVRPVTRISTAIRVVGLQYTRSIKFVATARVGDDLTLRLEPTNVADSNAVAVYSGDRKVGYIEKAEARTVKNVIEGCGEAAVTATISRIDTKADIYNMMWVVIEATYYVKA